MPRKKPHSRRRYATDLTDSQWALIEPLSPETRPGGRPRKAPARELVNAVRYCLRAGSAWRLMPHDLPPWQTAYYYLRRWQREGVWEHVHHTLLLTASDGTVSHRLQRRSWTASRSAPPIKRGAKGLDAGRKITGRKRHILTDTREGCSPSGSMAPTCRIVTVASCP